MKKTNILILSVMVVLVLFSIPAYSTEQQLTQEQIKQCIKSYKTEPVIAVRKFLNSYAKDILSSEYEKEAGQQLVNLKISKKQAFGKFILFSAGAGVGGGEIITIIFQDSQNLILNLWVMDYKPYEVIAAWLPEFNDEQIRIIKKTCKPLLDNPDFGF